MADCPADLELDTLKSRLNYEIQDLGLLTEALRHSSFVNECADGSLRDNERLEFLGDAVLNLVVGHVLMKRFPHVAEGELSRMRAHLVNETQLAELARELDLGRHIQLGRGEIQTHGREKNSILADAFEALLAAIYLDGGFEAVFVFIQDCFASLFDTVHHAPGNLDYKSKLQELVQRRQQGMPRYQVVGQSGPDHDKTFRVRLKACDTKTEGAGKSKKLAEQDAARKALEFLEQAEEPDSNCLNPDAETTEVVPGDSMPPVLISGKPESD